MNELAMAEMNQIETELIMLGTGNATVTKCYNTCFILQTKETVLLVDGGGGNGILNQLEKVDVPIDSIHDMFVTHAHTDHILGAVWMIRIIAQRASNGHYFGTFRVYGHDKEKQYGFRALLPNGKSLVCLGDEPYNEQVRSYTEGVDWLLCEAFCLYKDRERFKPYEKHHSTALDAGRLAQQLGIKRLLLYHTEDKTLATRKESYTEEASREFSGLVYVPDDLEKILL